MEALARVHDCEIVHRDISPDNIMMMADGTAKLLDFGAVRNIESMDADQDLQHSTEAILKHGFAPMEQYQKRGALGPWTDEYAMCATVYYCLTGRVPPDAPQRMMEDVHPAWEKIPGLSSSQRMVLEKGMSLRGKDRYPNVRELMAALYGQEPQPAAEPIMATKPVQPMEMTAPEPVEEAEVPAYTAPMMTAPVEHVELPVQKKKRGGLIAGLVAAAVLLVAGFVALGILPKPEVHEPPAEEAPVIATEAPETTAPVETTEATTAPTEPTTTPTEPATTPTEPAVTQPATQPSTAEPTQGVTAAMEATPTEPTPQQPAPQTFPWWAVLLVGFAGVGAGVGITVVILKKK
jgi:serine/threonine protein kinase